MSKTSFHFIISSFFGRVGDGSALTIVSPYPQPYKINKVEMINKKLSKEMSAGTIDDSSTIAEDANQICYCQCNPPFLFGQHK